jgi:hypothetical protein
LVGAGRGKKRRFPLSKAIFVSRFMGLPHFLPLLSPARGEKGVGGMREVEMTG